jgi:hypothetical protein
MKVLEQLARGMCRKAGHDPDQLVFTGPLATGPHGTFFQPDRNRMFPLWNYYCDAAEAALELLKDLDPAAEE